MAPTIAPSADARVDPALVDAVRDVVREVLRDELRDLLARPRRRSPSLNRRDLAKLSPLLAAIAGSCGSEYFTVSELLDDHAAVAAVIGTMPPATVGRLLQRAIGVPIDGYVVERGDGVELHRRLWRVVATL